MWWLLLFLVTSAFAQVADDLSLVPKTPIARDHIPPMIKVNIKEIRNSPTWTGAMKSGFEIIHIKTNEKFVLTKSIFVKFHEIQDEFGFRYLVNKDGSCSYKTLEHFVEPVRNDLVLYEPPHRYTPAPLDMTKTIYDRKLVLLPEASLYAGLVQGGFMEDLFNDAKAAAGRSNQFAARLFTDWELPVKVGAGIHYEATDYELAAGGSLYYSSLSFGPQIKSKDFIWGDDFPVRIQANFRVSPFSRAEASTATGKVNYKFNSSDFMASLEHPIKNGWGEFVVGLYGQWQWLNLKDAPAVSIRATNRTNNSFGLSLSQVFQ